MSLSASVVQCLFLLLCKKNTESFSSVFKEYDVSGIECALFPLTDTHDTPVQRTIYGPSISFIATDLSLYCVKINSNSLFFSDIYISRNRMFL